MIYKVNLYLIALTLVQTSSAYASTEFDSFDMSGLHSMAGEKLPEDSNFHAIAGFDSSSFLYSSDVRGTSSTTFEATLEDSFSSDWMVGKGDLQFYSFVDGNPSVGVESQELYLSTKPGALGNSQFTIGRKLYEWSKLDKVWNMMSLWSPRWTWDELHPELVGMTGLFYTYTTKNFQFIAFGSPLAIPERGTDTEAQNGKIVSSNPLQQPLPTTINVNGAQTSVNYSLDTPSLSSILFRPNFALRARYEFDSGYWISANSGVLPVNMVQLAAEPYLNTANNSGDIDVNIHPEFPMRNINTVETGYDARDWDIWGSVSYEQPFNFENNPLWLNPIITPSTIVSAGMDFKVTHNFTFTGAALYIQEQPFTTSSSSELSGIDVALPSRFPLKQGIKVGGNWKFSELTESNFSWTQDLLYSTHLVSADIEHQFYKYKITAGLGLDLVLADTNQGYVGQYYGDDRFRGWLKYAF
jgi:hypothetical protein